MRGYWLGSSNEQGPISNVTINTENLGPKWLSFIRLFLQHVAALLEKPGKCISKGY